MKKLMSMVLSLAVIMSLSAAAFAAESETAGSVLKLGEAKVTVSKTWDDAGNESERPESVTVYVGDQAVTLDAAGGWQAFAVVDAFAEDGSLRSYAVTEEPVEGYTTVVDPGTVMMEGLTVDSNLQAVRRCDTTTKYFEYNNLAIFKKGGAYIVWTKDELTEGAKTALMAAIESLAIEDLMDMGTPDFEYGHGEMDLNGQNVTITEEGEIHFEDSATWSWFYHGTIGMTQSDYSVSVTNTYVPQYEWGQYDGDSATGYDPNGQIADDNWFMYNTVNVADWETGHSETFPIQAGQWKNGTNFVGSYTLTKSADSQFVIAYTVNPDYFANMEKPEDYKLQFDDVKIWINDTGSFLNSPGFQDDLATAVAVNEAFGFNGDTLYVFAHFDVTYWKLMPKENAIAYVIE